LLGVAALALAGCPPPGARRPDAVVPGPDHRPDALRVNLAAEAQAPDAWLARGLARLMDGRDLAGAADDLTLAAEGLPAPRARARTWLALGLLETGRARFAEAQEALLRSVEADPTAPEAVLAALSLGDLGGLISAGQESTAARLGALCEAAPPPEVARALRALRLSGARRAGQEAEARALAAELGRPPVYRVSLPWGQHGLVDLDRALPRPDAPIHPAEALRLYPQETEDGELFVDVAAEGVLAAEAFFRLPGDAELGLWASGPGSYRLFLDGLPVLSQDAHRRHGPRLLGALVRAEAGWHRLLIKAPLRAGRARLTLDLLGADGRPLGLHWAGRHEPPPDHLARALPIGLASGAWEALEADSERQTRDALSPWLSAQLLWQLGDLKGARARLRQAEERAGRFPLAAYLDGLVMLEDPDLPPGIDAVRARERLEVALDQAPGLDLARYRLALLDGEHGLPERALEALAALDERHPSVHLWPLARARLLERAGWGPEAEAAFRQAMARNPDDPEAVTGLLQRAVRGHALAAADALAGRLEALGRADLDTAELWHGRGEQDRVRAWLGRQLAHTPGRAELRLWWIDRLLGRRQLGEAEQALAEARASLGPTHPAAAELALRQAELHDLRGQGDQARALRLAVSRAHPADVRLRRALSAQGGERGVRLPGDLGLDARALIADYQRGPALEAGTVVVLDHAAAEVAPDGSALERVHTLVHLQSPEAVEQWGEVGHVPQGALIERLRVLSPDGRAREAEIIPGKDSASLPALKVGDFVELAFVQSVGGRTPLGRAYLGQPFLFQAAQAPIVWSRLSVAVPAGTPLQVDARNDAPEARRETVDGLDVWSFERRGAPAVQAERHAPPAQEYLPLVQVGFGLSWATHRALLATELWEASRPVPEVARWARETAGPEGGTRAGLRRLFRRALAEVRQTDRAFDFELPAESMLAARQGNRVTLLVAALRALGLEPRVLLGRSLGQVQTDPGLPALGSFPQGLIRVAPADGGSEVWLDPAERFHAFDRLYPYLGGMRALDLGTPEALPEALFEELPPVPADRLQKLIRLELELTADGALTGQGSERIDTAQAVQYRDLLSSMSEAQRRQVLEAGLGAAFPGARLQGFEIQALDEADEPLILRYRFLAPRQARVRQGRLFLRGGFYPYQLVAGLLTPGPRTTPLLMADATMTRTEVSVRLPLGARVEPPPEVTLTGPLSEFRLRVWQEGDLLRIAKSLKVAPGRVLPGDYPTFSAFCHQVDAADTAAITIRLP
jgi:tetratricopeptide (TPR) repeat protein